MDHLKGAFRGYRKQIRPLEEPRELPSSVGQIPIETFLDPFGLKGYTEVGGHAVEHAGKQEARDEVAAGQEINPPARGWRAGMILFLSGLVLGFALGAIFA